MIVRARFRHPHPGRAIVGTGGGTAVFVDGEGAVDELVLNAWQAAGVAVDRVPDVPIDQNATDIAESDTEPSPDQPTPAAEPKPDAPKKRTRRGA